MSDKFDKYDDILDEADLNGDGKIDDTEMLDLFDLLEEQTDAAGRRRFSSAKSPRRNNRDPYDDERRLFSPVKSSRPDDDEDDDREFDDDEEDEEEIELERDRSLDAKLGKYSQKIDEMIAELQKLRDAEEKFIDEGYETYGDTDRYEQAEENVNRLDDAISDLNDASFSIRMAGM